MRIFIYSIGLFVIGCVIGQLEITPILDGIGNKVEYDNEQKESKIDKDSCENIRENLLTIPEKPCKKQFQNTAE